MPLLVFIAGCLISALLAQIVRHVPMQRQTHLTCPTGALTHLHFDSQEFCASATIHPQSEQGLFRRIATASMRSRWISIKVKYSPCWSKRGKPSDQYYSRILNAPSGSISVAGLDNVKDHRSTRTDRLFCELSTDASLERFGTPTFNGLETARASKKSKPFASSPLRDKTQQPGHMAFSGGMKRPR